MLVQAQTCGRKVATCGVSYSLLQRRRLGASTHEENQSRQRRHVTLANQSQRLGKVAIPRANETQPSNGTHGDKITSSRAETNRYEVKQSWTEKGSVNSNRSGVGLGE